MIKYRKDMLEWTEANAQRGNGILQVVKLFNADEVEGSMTVCDLFSFRPGDSIGLHTHVGEGELYYIIKGCAKVVDAGKEYMLKAGDAHYCPNGDQHSISNPTSETMCMLAIVIPNQKNA